MTIRHLKIFTAVADYGGMSKAAKMLHISQPSISQAVSELEKHYGVKLFERLSQKIYLTKEGELMLSFPVIFSIVRPYGSGDEPGGRNNKSADWMQRICGHMPDQ